LRSSEAEQAEQESICISDLGGNHEIVGSWKPGKDTGSGEWSLALIILKGFRKIKPMDLRMWKNW